MSSYLSMKLNNQKSTELEVALHFEFMHKLVSN